MEFPGMDFAISSQNRKADALPSPGGPIEFIKSLWSDPFKW